MAAIPTLDQIWTTGHSLGGALASLTALIMNTAAITFASPGELLYAYRLRIIPGITNKRSLELTPLSSNSIEVHLYTNNFNNPYNEDIQYLKMILPEFDIYNFGNDQDPIFNATCKGKFSICYWMGYVLESRCHIGKECVYSKNDDTLNPNNALRKNLKIFSYFANGDLSGYLYTHRMAYYLDNYIIPAKSVPKCTPNVSCLETECYDWDFR